VSQPENEFTPPGNLPLYEGLDPEWNDIVGALPEDRRAELAPKLKERLDAFTPLKQYEDFHKSGVTNDQIQQALQLSTVIDNHPRQVYEKLAEFLGISREEAKEVVEEVEEGVEDGDDPRYAALKKQIDVLSQIMLNENQQKTQAQLNAQADAAIDKEINTVKKKFGDVDEEQLLLYMGRGLNAEQAYQAYTKRDADIRARRPAPTLLGSGQAVPRQAPDMAKMSPEDTRKFVAQMMEHGRQESRG
jgi:hypothetical protein